MYEEEFHFRNCYLNSFVRFDPGDLDIWPSDPKIIEFLCYPGWMCDPSLRKAGQGILQLLNGKGFDTFDSGDLDLWPNYASIKTVSLLPKMDVWTKFEKGRSRRSRAIDRKPKGNRRTDRQTHPQTNRHVQSNMPSLLRRGGIKIVHNVHTFLI